MLTEEPLTAIWLNGSIVKWVIMPALEQFPRVKSMRVGAKRALVTALCVLSAPIYSQCSSVREWLVFGLSAALVAIGQHHLIKGNREK